MDGLGRGGVGTDAALQVFLRHELFGIDRKRGVVQELFAGLHLDVCGIAEAVSAARCAAHKSVERVGAITAVRGEEDNGILPNGAEARPQGFQKKQNARVDVLRAYDGGFLPFEHVLIGGRVVKLPEREVLR